MSTAQSGHVYLAEVERLLAPYFERTEPRRRAVAYGQALFSPTEFNNSGQLTEVSGHATLYGLQHSLGRALWRVDAARDDAATLYRATSGGAQAVLVSMKPASSRAAAIPPG